MWYPGRQYRCCVFAGGRASAAPLLAVRTSVVEALHGIEKPGLIAPESH
ncbi:MAG: hypothetical protein U0787_16490 [Polyangia bacterium]